MDRRTFIQVGAVGLVACVVPALAATSQARLSCIADGAKNNKGRIYPASAWDEALRRFREHPAPVVRLQEDDPAFQRGDILDIVGFISSLHVDRTDGPECYKVFASVTLCDSPLAEYAQSIKRPYLVPTGRGMLDAAGHVSDYKFLRWEISTESSFVHAEPLCITPAKAA